MYMYVCIDICVCTYFCTHHVHSAPVSEQMNKLQRTTAYMNNKLINDGVAKNQYVSRPIWMDVGINAFRWVL